MSAVSYRVATAADAPAVAALHADSWRRHYRGAYADSFLDGDVVADRLTVWGDRLTKASAGASTVVAERDGHVVGFVHTVLGADERWGALLDNLHVVAASHRSGVGTRLIAESARFVAEHSEDSPLYLWVLEQNGAAQRFYDAVGGTCAEIADVPPVGGVPGRLNGRPRRLRYVWPDPRLLADLASRQGAGVTRPCS